MAENTKTKKLSSGRHPSAIKRFRQSEKRRFRNRRAFSNLKTAIKTLQASVAQKKKDEIAQHLNTIVSLVSKAASKKLMHQNKAQRMISQFMKSAKI